MSSKQGSKVKSIFDSDDDTDSEDNVVNSKYTVDGEDIHASVKNIQHSDNSDKLDAVLMKNSLFTTINEEWNKAASTKCNASSPPEESNKMQECDEALNEVQSQHCSSAVDISNDSVKSNETDQTIDVVGITDDNAVSAGTECTNQSSIIDVVGISPEKNTILDVLSPPNTVNTISSSLVTTNKEAISTCVASIADDTQKQQSKPDCSLQSLSHSPYMENVDESNTCGNNIYAQGQDENVGLSQNNFQSLETDSDFHKQFFDDSDGEFTGFDEPNVVNISKSPAGDDFDGFEDNCMQHSVDKDLDNKSEKNSGEALKKDTSESTLKHDDVREEAKDIDHKNDVCTTDLENITTAGVDYAVASTHKLQNDAIKSSANDPTLPIDTQEEQKYDSDSTFFEDTDMSDTNSVSSKLRVQDVYTDSENEDDMRHYVLKRNFSRNQQKISINKSKYLRYNEYNTGYRTFIKIPAHR